MRLTDLLVAFIDPNAEIDPNPPSAANAADKKEKEEEEEEEIDTGPDIGEAMDRYKTIKRLHNRHLKSLDKKGYGHAATRKIQNEIIDQLMEIKFTPKIVDRLWDDIRDLVEEVRTHEKAIMDMAVRDARISRRDFIKIFQESETNTTAL